ncbi:MAG: hypothetical protein PHS41_10770 [Victivallaceae bacterium]|nr:hypothetical protein [Victivallaceae bacterium]
MEQTPAAGVYLPFVATGSSGIGHDFDFAIGGSYWKFTIANLRLAYNSCRDGIAFVGIAAAILCQLFGWMAWKEAKK